MRIIKLDTEESQEILDFEKEIRNKKLLQKC